MEYDGNLGIYFLRKQQVCCDYKKQELKIGNVTLKIQPYDKITLKPRETIVQAATNRNEIGIIQAEETAPEVFIRRCLVEPRNYLCLVSVINTTDETVEIRTLVIVEDNVGVGEDNTHNVYTIQTEDSRNNLSPRHDRICNNY